MAQMVNNMPVMQETQVQSLGWEDPLEKGMTPVFLPGEFHGRRSLVGYRPRGHKESDQLTLSLFPLWLYYSKRIRVRTSQKEGCIGQVLGGFQT